MAGEKLSAHGVHFSYGSAAVLEGVSLSISPGECIAIVGPNGSGKSTLLRLLLGHLAPSRGVVTLGEKNLANIPRRDLAGKIAMVAQSAAAPFGYSVREIVLMARYHAHAGFLPTFETADDFRIADEAMWAMDVHHLADRPITTLSGGERQRVMIARALAQQSPIILFDEPTSALDLHHQLELIEQMRVLSQAGKAVVWVTHDLSLAYENIARTAVMDQGRIVADGPTRDVLTPAVLEPVYRVSVKVDAGRLEFRRRSAQ